MRKQPHEAKGKGRKLQCTGRRMGVSQRRVLARYTRFLKGKSMGNSDQGIVKDDKAQEQPKDKKRAQTAHETEPDKSVSRENTRDPASRKGPVLD
jgi:hypothetical protein